MSDLTKEHLQFCTTDAQREVLQTILENKCSYSVAAKLLGITKGSVQKKMSRVKRNAALHGFSPEHDLNRISPPGFAVKGISDMVENKLGKPQWVKMDRDRQSQAKIAEIFLEEIKAGIKPEKVNKAKPRGRADLLNLYVVTDYHFGMYAWAEETRGQDWDVDIAEETLVNWYKRAIQERPKAEQAICCFLGDSVHFDSTEAITPTAKHLLDADTRFARVVRLWIRVRRQVHQMLLSKYPNVHLIDAEGNHDPVTSIHQREWWNVFYESEPRFTVDTDVDPYYAYEWGDTSLFFHHGHKRRPTNIQEVFAAKFREIFGRTKYSYGHMGHMHHKLIDKENPLMMIEQHRTLAAGDAYASRHGFISGREAQAITYHKKYGEVGRSIITPEMLK